MSVETAWNRLKETFFELHPEVPNLLNPGAARAEIACLERFFPELPQAVYALWGINDGESGGPPYGALMLGFELLKVQTMMDYQELWNRIADDSDEDGVNEIEGSVFPEGSGKADYFSRTYLVFGDDFSGDSLVMDMAPGPTGTPGQITLVGTDVIDRYVIADGLESFFDLLTSVHTDPRLKLSWDAERRSGKTTWSGDQGALQTDLLDLLPVLYAEGRLYQAR